MKKVIVYITSEGNYNQGGGQNITKYLMDNISGNEYDIILITSGDLHKYTKNEVKYIDINLNEKFNLNTYLKLRSTIKSIIKNNSQVIIHNQSTRSLPIVFISTLGIKYKFIHTEHVWTKDYRLTNKFRTWLNLILIRICYFKIQKVICVSNAVKNFLHENLKQTINKLVLVYNGIDNETQINKTKHNGINLISIGNFNFIKNYSSMIRIVSKLNRKNWKLIIVGYGKEEKYIKKLIKEYKLLDRVEVWNYDKKLELLSIGDIYLQTSISESFGMGISEAMSYGIPVVSYDVGGISEQVINNKNGYLVTNEDEMVKKIQYLIDNKKEIERMGKSAEKNRNKFPIDMMVKKNLEIYKQILK